MGRQFASFNGDLCCNQQFDSIFSRLTAETFSGSPPNPFPFLPQIWTRWWESPGALSFGTSGQFCHVWKPLPWPYPLTTIKKPQDHLLSLSLKSFADQLGKPTLLSPESIIMWMVNIFISSWHVCGVISFDTETVFWVGSILYLYSG